MRAVILLVAVVTASSWALPLVNRGGAVVDDADVAPARFASADINLRDLLESADVRWGDDPGDGYTGHRWVSGKEPWLWVGPYRGLLSARDPDPGRHGRSGGPTWRPCIWAHAAGPASAGGPGSKDPGPGRGPKARPLRIHFAGLPRFGRVYGEVGLLDTLKDGADVDFSIAVGTERPSRVVVRDARGDKRWQPFEVRADGQEVTFQVSATDANWRQLCFTAFVERAP